MGDLSGLHDEAASVISDTEYTLGARDSYVNNLHGRASDLAEENRSIAELAYGNVLQNAALQDNWFDQHVLVIPCLYVRRPRF